MNNKWKIVCDKVATTTDLSEKEFEKGVATLILSFLGWNEFEGNIKEQYKIDGHAKDYFPDFALFPQGEKSPGILVELKKTAHQQRTKDVKQIKTYMMLSNCFFCIYFGEKMELFYVNQYSKNRTLKSVLTLDYNPMNPDGNRLLDLISYATFDENKLIQFCEDRLSADEAAAFFSSLEGHKRIYEMMAKDRQLSEEAANLLASMLTLPERKSPAVETITEDVTGSQVPEKDTPSTEDVKPRFCSLPTLGSYLNNLKSEKMRQVMERMGITLHISKINDIPLLEKILNEVRIFEDERGMHNTHSCALSKYIAYINAGFSFEDMEYDAKLAKNAKKIQGKKEDKRKPSTINTKAITGKISGNSIIFTQEMKQAGGKCQMTYYPESKRYVVNKGSNILDKSYGSCGRGIYDLREEVKKNETLCRKDGDLYTLLEDIVIPQKLSSPTGASKFCWGTSRPGPSDWKDEEGKTYPSEWWRKA